MLCHSGLVLQGKGIRLAALKINPSPVECHGQLSFTVAKWESSFLKHKVEINLAQRVDGDLSVSMAILIVDLGSVEHILWLDITCELLLS